MLGVGARWETKRWPPENFGAVARQAIDRFGGSVIFIGTRDDAEISKMVKLNQPGLNLCGQTSLQQLAAVLERADAVLANDTGPLHLAAALGRPTIAPYTCTLVVRHGPYGQFQRTASATVDCHGSYRKTCDHLSCMPTLTPERLIANEATEPSPTQERGAPTPWKRAFIRTSRTSDSVMTGSSFWSG